MKITVLCRCGCSATFDAADIPIGERMVPVGEKDLRLWVDAKADEWQKLHMKCLEIYQTQGDISDDGRRNKNQETNTTGLPQT